MAITHKDINLLSQKSTIAGTEKIPVSDTEYVTTNQIASLADGGGQANVIETVKVNGTALTPDANKAVDVPVPIEHITISTVADPWFPDAGELSGLYAAVHACCSAGHLPVVHLSDGTADAYESIWTLVADMHDDSWYDFQTIDLDGVRIITLRIASGDTFTLDFYTLDIGGKEDKSNKVTTLSPSSTNTQYPSAKCVYDNIQKIVVIWLQGPQSGDIEDVTSQDFSGLYTRVNPLIDAGFCPTLRLELTQYQHADFKYCEQNEDGFYCFRYTDHTHIYEAQIYEGTGSGGADYYTYSIINKGTTSGNGNAVTDVSVSGNTITLTKGSTFLTAETDPVFTASAAHGISSTDISNWNAKQKAITVSSSEPTVQDGSNGDIWIVI